MPANDNKRRGSSLGLPPLKKGQAAKLGGLKSGTVGASFQAAMEWVQEVASAVDGITAPDGAAPLVGYELGSSVFPNPAYWQTHLTAATGTCTGNVPVTIFDNVHASTTCFGGTSVMPNHVWETFNNGIKLRTLFTHFRVRLVEPNPNYPGSSANPQRWTYPICYQKKAGAPERAPVVEPHYVPVSPTPVPGRWPLSQPWDMPAFPPQVAPQPAKDPKKEPSKAEDDKPPFYELPPFFPVPFYVTTPGITTLPRGVGIGLDPGGNPTLEPLPPKGEQGHASSSRPPGGRSRKKAQHKIRKRMHRRLIGIGWAGLNSATEAMDFVQAMHKSLDKRHRLSPKASKAQVIRYMMTTPTVWQHIDFAEAVQNYVQMQWEDMLYAVGSDQIKNVSRDMGSLTGLDNAVNSPQGYWGDAQQAAQEAGHDVDTSQLDDIIPTLDIDTNANQVSLRLPGGWTLSASKLGLGGDPAEFSLRKE